MEDAQQNAYGAGTRIKCVVVGDGGSGKTSLLTMYTEGEFPEQYTPTVFENYTKEASIGKTKVVLMLWDTAGQEDYDRLRPLSYDKADVIVLCYDVTSMSSFRNIDVRWAPEVRHFCGGIPRILVACKTDLRPEEGTLNRTQSVATALTTTDSPNGTPSREGNSVENSRAVGPKTTVTTEMGSDMAKSIEASSFIECSAKDNLNVQNVFLIACEQVLKPDGATDNDCGCCNIM